MRSSLLSCLAVVFVGSVGACSSSSSSPISAVDAAIADAAPFDAPPGPDTSGVTVCNTMAVSGTAVTLQVADAQAAPTPAGGTIADGTYHLTALTQYGGTEQYSYNDAGIAVPYASTEVLVIAGTQWEVAGSDSANPSYTTNFLVAPVTGATNVELDESCPDGETSTTISFTATPTSLTWFVMTNGLTTVSTFTKD